MTRIREEEEVRFRIMYCCIPTPTSDNITVQASDVKFHEIFVKHYLSFIYAAT